MLEAGALVLDVVTCVITGKSLVSDVQSAVQSVRVAGREMSGFFKERFSNINKNSILDKVKNRKKISIDKIYNNPKDDIFTRKPGGYNDDSLSFHKKYIAENGDIYRSPDDILTVYDLGNGTYMLQNGHQDFVRLR